MTEAEMQEEIINLKERLKAAEDVNVALKSDNANKDKEMDELRKLNGKLFNRVGAIIDGENKGEDELTDDEKDEETIKRISKIALGGK